MSAPQRLTPRGHVHGEAFCLMWYVCRTCGHRERIWNSRDGVTPFGMCCPSCGGHEMLHSFFGSDVYAPDHKLHDGQRFWRDGTPDEAEAIMRERIEMFRDQYPTTPQKEAELIALARDPDAEHSEFRRGWPMLDVHDRFAVSGARRRLDALRTHISGLSDDEKIHVACIAKTFRNILLSDNQLARLALDLVEAEIAAKEQKVLTQ